MRACLPGVPTVDASCSCCSKGLRQAQWNALSLPSLPWPAPPPGECRGPTGRRSLRGQWAGMPRQEQRLFLSRQQGQRWQSAHRGVGQAIGQQLCPTAERGLLTDVPCCCCQLLGCRHMGFGSKEKLARARMNSRARLLLRAIAAEAAGQRRQRRQGGLIWLRPSTEGFCKPRWPISPISGRRRS